MIISRSEALAIYLREHPSVIVKDDNGTEFCYNPFVDKYYYQKKNNKVHNGIYVARGLQCHWEAYARRLKSAEDVLPFEPIPSCDIGIEAYDEEGVLPF